MKSSYFLLGTALVLLAGCSSSQKTMEDIALAEAKVASIRVDAESDRKDNLQEIKEKQLDEVPQWALEVLRPDSTGMYAVGMGKSTDLRTALRKAQLDAEYGLAKLYKQELSGNERSLNREGTNGEVTRSYSEVIDKLVTQVPVVGFEIVKQDIKPMEGEYHSFILIKLPYDEFNKVLTGQRQQNSLESVEVTFAELEQRLATRRRQLLKEERVRHEMHMEELAIQQQVLTGDPLSKTE